MLLTLLAAAAILLLDPARAAADEPPKPPVTVEARADRDTITVGDRVLLTVVAQAAPGVTLQPPARDEEAFGTFEVLERRPGTVQPTPDGGQILRLEYVVTAFAPGSVVLPGLGVPFSDRQGLRGTAYGPDLPVVIRSMLEDDPNPQLLDLKPPLAIPGGASNTLRSLASGLAVAAALALAALVLRRLPSVPQPLAPHAHEPPKEAARRELEAIVAEGLLQRGQYPAFYRRLALCVRRYLEDRYGLPALSCTSAELAWEMARRRSDRWLARVVTGLLEECDAVRWAGYLPAEARAKRALYLAFAIVELEAESLVGAR